MSGILGIIGSLAVRTRYNFFSRVIEIFMVSQKWNSGSWKLWQGSVAGFASL